MKNIVIRPSGGLCNRLRYIFSFMHKFKLNEESNNKKLIIIWRNDEYCPGYIHCFFQKIKNVEFVDKYSKHKIIPLDKSISYYFNINYLDKISLFLNENIFKKIRKIINKKLNNSYVAIHIRRTDLQEILKKHPKKKERIITDEQYIKFIKDAKIKNIYLATDNIKSQRKFMKLYKDRLIVYKEIQDMKDIRKTNIEHALIDLFICGSANKFRGSYYSSYSNFIRLMQKICEKNKDPISKLTHFYKV